MNQETVKSLRGFKSRRDDLLHEDVSTFKHNLERFVAFCKRDELVQSILAPLDARQDVDVDAWWEASDERERFDFPEDDPDRDLILRWRLVERAVNDTNLVDQFGIIAGGHRRDDWINQFRVLLVRPLVEELSDRLGNAVNLATPEARSLQAVPLHRIPDPREIRIFLSHKSVDKPLVQRYYEVLKACGFDPWLDDPEMPAGVNPDRGIYKGLAESCAAVFFITENYVDEKYLAAEIDNAVHQKHSKGEKFAIITLRYSNAAPVPELLGRWKWINVSNDLEGLYELIRALPIELRPPVWKDSVAS